MKYSDVKIKHTKKKSKSPKWVVWAIVLVVGFLGFMLLKNIKNADFNPISIVTSVAAADLKETDGRINVLVLGSDRRSNSGVVYSELTDTMLVASIGRYTHDVVLISIPRDLWVEDSRGYHMKINSVYTLDGLDQTTGIIDHNKGTEELTKIIEKVLGIPIHYHVLVNFQMFTDMVDQLGGIEIDVEKEFTDREYPIEGKENAPENERYETVHFSAGKQTMNGEQALKFSRSRHGDNGEGTDFARSRRQQKVIMAVKDKALSVQTIINPNKLIELYNTYSQNVQTNMDLGTIQNFYLLSQQIKFDKVQSIVLDDRSEADAGGLLYHPEDASLYGGAYVLIPRTGNYTQIHAYVQKYIFGDK
jgi:polyisoprenyl-teichoic acid--peptidoglycan teichoic acid transferase